MARRKKTGKIIRQAFEAPMLRLGMAVIPRLPRQAVLFLSRCMGSIAFHASARTRRLGLANLDVAFGETKSEREKKRILKKSLCNFSLVMLDLLWFSRKTEARLERWLSVSGAFQANADRPGARVGVTGHFGNWELTGRLWGRKTGGIMSVAMPLKNPAVDAMLQRMREQNGQIVVERKGALRKLVKHLKAQGTIGLLLDQNTAPEEGGIFADFFGLPVSVSSAAGILAGMTGAEIIFAYSLPQPDGSYRGELPHAVSEEEIAAMDRNTLAETLTRRITGYYEEAIRTHPECWLWSYKRWRYIPDGAPADRYPYYASPLKEKNDV